MVHSFPHGGLSPGQVPDRLHRLRLVASAQVDERRHGLTVYGEASGGGRTETRTLADVNRFKR
jgi:hypothetical protein